MLKAKQQKNKDSKDIKDSYRLKIDPKDKSWSVLVLDDKFFGIVIEYKQMQLSDVEDANGKLPLSFTYDILGCASEITKIPEIGSTEEQELVQVLGDILMDVVNDSLAEVPANEELILNVPDPIK